MDKDGWIAIEQNGLEARLGDCLGMNPRSTTYNYVTLGTLLTALCLSFLIEFL